MKRISALLLGLLLTCIFTLPAGAGTLTTNKFLYKPSLGARGDTEKKTFDAGLDRVDARLSKEIWVGDPNYGTTIQSAITAIGTTNKVILRIPADTWTISADLTVPANITLKPERGAIITNAGATTKNLTIAGGFDAGLYQVFSFSGTGKVVFGSGSVEKFYPQWWGAIGDYNTDCTAAINQMTASLRAQKHGRVYFPDGHYKVTGSLNFTDLTDGGGGLRVEGGGLYTTMIHPNLSSAHPVFDFTGSHAVRLSNMWIRGIDGGLQSANLLFARMAGTLRGDEPVLTNVGMDGYVSKVAVAFVSADLSTIDNSYIAGPCGVYYGSWDDLGVTSAFATIETAVLGNTLHNQKMTTVYATADNGWCVKQVQPADLVLVACYYAALGAPGTTQYGILVSGSLVYPTSACNGLTMLGFRFEANPGHAALYPIYLATTLSSANISATDLIVNNAPGIYIASGASLIDGLIRVTSVFNWQGPYSDKAWQLGDVCFGSAVIGKKLFKVTTAGTSTGGEPTWNTTPGATTTSVGGGVVWTCFEQKLFSGGGVLRSSTVYNYGDYYADLTGSYGNIVHQNLPPSSCDWFSGDPGAANIVISQQEIVSWGRVLHGSLTSGKIKARLDGSEFKNFGTINAAAYGSLTLTVTGAKIGDIVEVGYGFNGSTGVPVPAGVLMTGAVTADDTVTFTAYNATAAPVTFNGGVAWAIVTQKFW